jgi:hypothetical protein
MAQIRYFPGQNGLPIRQNAVPKYAPEEQPSRDAEKFCIYNLTRQRFVETNVEAADGSDAGVETRLWGVGAGYGTALWIAPFREISPTSVRFPLDLIILNGDFVVAETVESFPVAAVGTSGATAASLVVLPADSLARGEIRVGDRLMISSPEEMKQYLQRLQQSAAKPREAAAPPSEDAGEARLEQPTRAEAAKGEVVKDEPPLDVVNDDANRSSQPARPEVSSRLPEATEPAAEPSQQPQPWKKEEPKNWFMRLLVGESQDPRKLSRHALPGLVAYFFTGGTPKEQAVRDISGSGLYIITSERWYIGTVVRITLTDRRSPTAERSITVNAKVVRLGSDGVGLEFVLAGDGRRHGKSFELADQSNGVDAAQVEEFLRKYQGK